MNAFVLDRSIAVSWCFDDEFDPAADALLKRVRDAAMRRLTVPARRVPAVPTS